MNIPSWPTLTVDEIAGLTFGAALLIQWGGDGFPEAARFEDRQGMPAREDWVTLADVIDGETKVWLNVDAAPLPAEAIEELKLTPAQISEREAEARLAEIAKGDMIQKTTEAQMLADLDYPQEVIDEIVDGVCGGEEVSEHQNGENGAGRPAGAEIPAVSENSLAMVKALVDEAKERFGVPSVNADHLRILSEEKRVAIEREIEERAQAAGFDADFEEETSRERETREVFERLRREADERQSATKPAFPRGDRFYREPETRVWVRLEAPGVELRALLTPEAAKTVVDAMLGGIGANE